MKRRKAVKRTGRGEGGSEGDERGWKLHFFPGEGLPAAASPGRNR